MTWSDFKAVVDELLTVERNRLGAGQFVDRHIRLGIGDVQRLIDYYRRGITSTYEFDDLQRDGFASTGELPRGANLRELYHVRTGILWARRPLLPYEFSNRHDLRAGVFSVGCHQTHFRYAIDHRGGGRLFWIYPRVTPGYIIQVVWDAIIGRTNHEYRETDDVPFDEPMAMLVSEWVKMNLSREVDRDLNLYREYERTYRRGIASLFSEVQERLRTKGEDSRATCVPPIPCDVCHCTPCCCTPIGHLETDQCGPIPPSSGQVPVTPGGYPESFGSPGMVIGIGDYTGYPVPPFRWSPSCPEIEIPQMEWVMFGDSGEKETLEDTIAVATAIKALDPQFVIHLGDAAYAHDDVSGAALLYDMLERHYFSFLDEGRFYLAFGNHDLEVDYGAHFFASVTSLGLIPLMQRDARKYWYEFGFGPVRFFVLNMGATGSDENIHRDEQRAWLEERVAVAAEPWLVACYHRPAYTSDSAHAPGSSTARSFELHELGFDVAISAHGHNYERYLDAHRMTHIVCGLGGATRRGKSTTIAPFPGSQFFFSRKNGFLRCTATEDRLQITFLTTDNEMIDRITLVKS